MGWTDVDDYNNNNNNEEEFDDDGRVIVTQFYNADGDLMGNRLVSREEIRVYREIRALEINDTIKAVCDYLVAEVTTQMNAEDAEDKRED